MLYTAPNPTTGGILKVIVKDLDITVGDALEQSFGEVNPMKIIQTHHFQNYSLNYVLPLILFLINA